MTTQELIDGLHDLQQQLETRDDSSLDGAIIQISNAIERLENSVLASIAAKLKANEADLDAGIAALNKDLETLAKATNIIEDVGKVANIVAKLV
jgi:hypothetical protein